MQAILPLGDWMLGRPPAPLIGPDRRYFCNMLPSSGRELRAKLVMTDDEKNGVSLSIHPIP